MLRVVLLLALAPADAPPPAEAVVPFRTDAQPRVDPVFGDATALRASVDRFLVLQGEMERVRDEFSTAVHDTLTALGAVGAVRRRECPGSTAAPYARAQAAGRRFLALGQRLQTRFRDIRRADDLGDTVALTPDYRLRVKKARELYRQLLTDYREMKVAFYDQLGSEMRAAGCKLPDAPPSGSATATAEAGPNPSDPSAWVVEDPAASSDPEAPSDAPAPAAPRLVVTAEAPPRGKAQPDVAAAPAIWIQMDNTSCGQPTRLTLDGQPAGTIPARKRLAVRARSGPHDLCALPASDRRACGEAGTLRHVYLHEGWEMKIHCGK